MDAGRTWIAGLMGLVSLIMVMIVLYSSGEVGLALKSYLLALRSEPATSVENFVLRHSGLEQEGGCRKTFFPFRSRLSPQRLKYRSRWRQEGLNLARPEATLDEYIQEAGFEA